MFSCPRTLGRWVRRGRDTLFGWEDVLLSNRCLQLKRALFWSLTLGCVALLGVGNDWTAPPNHAELLHAPDAFSGVPIYFFFSSIRRGPEGEGVFLHSTLGWLPLRGERDAVTPGEIASVAGRWRADGSVDVDRVLRHPLRPLKTMASALAVVLLGGGLGLAWLVRTGTGTANRDREEPAEKA